MKSILTGVLIFKKFQNCLFKKQGSFLPRLETVHFNNSLKNIKMKYNNNIEVIFFSSELYVCAYRSKKDLIEWLTTILQPTIEKQHQGIKKIFLKTLEDALAINLS
jgi:hypothetical protein